TAHSKASWHIATPAPTPMTPNNTPGFYGAFANAPQSSALRSSIARLASYLWEQFLRSRTGPQGSAQPAAAPHHGTSTGDASNPGRREVPSRPSKDTKPSERRHRPGKQ